jgi:hypothetical protein
MAERVLDAYRLVDELHAAGFPADHPTMLAVKKMRVELLKIKGEIERELARWVEDCRRCNRRVHWVFGVGAEAGHWAHSEPAPKHRPVLST